VQISGVVASPSVQGVSANSPADIAYTQGFSAVGNGQAWVLTPGQNYAISALGTAVATATRSMVVDWTTAAYFTVTAYGGGWTITFNNAAGVFTPVFGQEIFINITHAASSAITWPSTVTWISAGAAGPTTTTNNCIVALLCTNAGSSPTFIGYIAAQVS